MIPQPNKRLILVDRTNTQATAAESTQFALSALRAALAEANVPSYVAVNRNDFSAELMRIPYRDEVPVLCDVQLVVEYYSR